MQCAKLKVRFDGGGPCRSAGNTRVFVDEVDISGITRKVEIVLDARDAPIARLECYVSDVDIESGMGVLINDKFPEALSPYKLGDDLHE